MEFRFEADELRRLISLVITETIDRLENECAKSGGRLAFTEPEAAALLGIKPYVLRDCRRRGELDGSKAGSKIVYTRASLLEFLERQKRTRAMPWEKSRK